MASRRIPAETSTGTTQPPTPTPNTFAPGGTTTTTVPSTTTTTAPKSTTTTPATSDIDPNLQDESIYSETADGKKIRYAIGVRGQRVYDSSGKLIKYEGYKYQSNPRYFTTSGAGAQTGTGMLAGPQTREPQYFTGDQDQIFGMSLETLATLQRAMSDVGLLGKDYAPGTADNATRAAFTNLLEIANGYGETYEQAIIRLASTGAGGNKGGLSQYRVSNENDVKNIISRVAKQTIGRNLGEGDLNRLAQVFRNLEQQAGMAAASTTQREVAAAPSVETFAQNSLEQMFPQETNARKFGSYMEAIKEKYGL